MSWFSAVVQFGVLQSLANFLMNALKYIHYWSKKHYLNVILPIELRIIL